MEKLRLVPVDHREDNGHYWLCIEGDEWSSVGEIRFGCGEARLAARKAGFGTMKSLSEAICTVWNAAQEARDGTD